MARLIISEREDIFKYNLFIFKTIFEILRVLNIH